MPVLSQHQVDAFARDGVILLRGYFTDYYCRVLALSVRIEWYSRTNCWNEFVAPIRPNLILRRRINDSCKPVILNC